ncbi:MAG: NrfD/PsrC family molybdoenzyme membrane anchor subunit [Thiohalomonadales bacterium]
MEGQVIANAMQNAYWGFPIALYFWLVGASAGSFVISSLGWVFGIKKYKSIAFFASNTAIVALLIVPVLLIIDLGKPYRFFHLYIFAHWSAPMVWGSFLIMTYPVAMAFYSFFVYKENQRWARRLGILAVVLAVSTHWYTGVVIQLNPSRVPNHTSVAPLLFLTSAYVSGIGLLILTVWLRNMLVAVNARVSPELLADMARLMLFGILFDLFLLGNEFLQLNYGTAEERTILYEVLLGVFRWPYLYLEIVWGLVLPMIILLIPRLNRSSTGVFIAAFMTATGVYGMRIWWVMAAQYYQGHF